MPNARKISRRNINQILFCLLASKSSLSFSGENPYEDTAMESTKWFNESSENKSVNGVLKIFRFKDPYYCTIEEISWEPTAEQDKEKFKSKISVPTGFVTDLASTPRILWSILPRDGDYCFPAIIHDYLYWDQSIKREDADLIFKLAMEDLDIEKSTVAAIYSAVRIFGESPWNKNRDLKNSGEKRLIKKLPGDQKIKWIDWRKDESIY